MKDQMVNAVVTLFGVWAAWVSHELIRMGRSMARIEEKIFGGRK